MCPLKLCVDKFIAQVEIWGERIRAMMTNELANGWFCHPFLHKLGDPGVPEEMGVYMRKVALVGVVLDHLLDGVDRQRTTTGFAFESDEDVVDVREEVSALIIEVSVQCSEGNGIHKHGSSVVAFCCGDADATSAALDILELNGYHFADPETTDPHQQHQGAIAPAGQHTKEGPEVVVRQDIGHTLGLFAV